MRFSHWFATAIGLVACTAICAQPPKTHGAKLSEVLSNRGRTQGEWFEGGVRFPCPELLAEKLKKGSLPPIFLHGEIHTDLYCRARRQVLIQGADSVCLAVEDYNAPAGRGEADRHPIKGLENPYVKELAMLFTAYEQALRARAGNIVPAEKIYQEHDAALSAVAFLESEMALDALQEVAGTHCGTKGLVCGKVAQAITHVKRAETLPPAVYAERLESLKSAVQAGQTELVDLLPEVIRKVAARLSALAKENKLREPISFPKKLQVEVEHTLQSISDLAANPSSPRCGATRQACFDYLSVAWRDQLMAFNLAQAYCDNLATENPKGFHAIVGERHVPGISQALETEVAKFKIPTQKIEGSVLASLFAQVYGAEAQDGSGYADQAARTEKWNGANVGYSVQRDGVRAFVLTFLPDPIPGTALNQSQAARLDGKQALFLYGSDKNYARFTAGLGLKSGEKLSPADRLMLATQIREAATQREAAEKPPVLKLR